MNRIKELQDYIAGQEPTLQTLMRLWPKAHRKIAVFAEHFTMEYKFGITIEIEAIK
jgi:hypothetical protein